MDEDQDLKRNKLRTSISIDPEILEKAKKLAYSKSGHRPSLSALIERALEAYIAQHGQP